MGSTVGFCSFCTQHEIARSSLSRPSLLQSLKPRQRLTHTTMEAMDWDTVGDPMDTDWVVLATATVMDFTMARGRQRLSPRLRLSPTTTVTVLATTGLVTGLVTATVMDFTTERGKPRLSPRLRLSPGWLVVTTVDSTTDLDTGPTVMAMDSTTERGKLRLSPRLRLIPTTMAVTTVDSATTDLVTGPTDSGTGPTGAEVP